MKTYAHLYIYDGGKYFGRTRENTWAYGGTGGKTTWKRSRQMGRLIAGCWIMITDQRLGANGSSAVVGHGIRRTGVKGRATLEDIRRWIDIARSNGAGKFCCPAIVRALTCGRAVSETVLRDTRCMLSGIAAPMVNTAGLVEAVWDNTAGFYSEIRTQGPPYKKISAPLI